MKMKYLLISLFALLLVSCGSSNKVHNLSSETVFKNGYWGDWNSTYYPYLNEYMYNVQTYYNADILNIVLYSKNIHPSDYDINIAINKKSGKVYDKTWYSYQGMISIGKINNINPHILGDNGKTYNCEIRCDEKMRKAINKNGLYGTMNIYYNGVGRAFSFH